MRAYARAACAVLALGFASCDNAVKDDFGGILDLSAVTGVATGPLSVRPKIGWSSGQRVEYYDFGTTPAANSVKDSTKIVAAANPMFVFVRSSDNQPLYSLSGTPERDGLAALNEPANPCYYQPLNYPPGSTCDASIIQHPIVDTVPGRADVTPFWEIVKVSVPDSYHLDDIKSKKTLDTAGFTYEYTGKVITCPIVDVTATRARAVTQTTASGRFFARLRFWYRRQLGNCLLVEGADQAALGLISGSTGAAPYAVFREPKGLITLTEVIAQSVIVPQYPAAAGVAGATPTVIGDNYIFYAMPGDSGGAYSPLDRIMSANVKPRPDGTAYKPGDYKSPADLMTAMVTPAATLNYNTLVILGFVPACAPAAPFCAVGINCDSATGAPGSFCSQIQTQ